MRGTGTWLVIAAVLGLGLAAAVDAFRGEDAPPASPPATRAVEPRPNDERALAARLLRDQSIRGTIAYRDPECGLHAVSLPNLEEQAIAHEPGCRFAATQRVQDVVTPPCRRGATAIPFGDASERVPGCRPAWKPNGALTLVRRGDLVEMEVGRSGSGEIALKERVVLSRADLRPLSRAPWALPEPVVLEAAWLTNDLVAVIARDPRIPDHVIVLFRGRRLVAGPPFPYPRLSALRVSPSGRFVAARIGDQGMLVLDQRGDLISSGIRTARAVAWSPDEVWTALATSDGIFVFPTGERAISLIRLPIVARDLVWR